jgi:hypothetical protein
VAPRFRGKTVALVGSGPGSLDNAPGFVDSHDIVVRVNNYRIMRNTGARTDVFYSFFGHSIKKTAEELQHDGVTLCLCKCPDDYAIDSEWHRRKRRLNGVDFRYIYESRAPWWFCDTYIPTTEDFLQKFALLGKRIPTTGFAAILDLLSFKPAALYLTGFDFFRSGYHNVTDPWAARNQTDPFAHDPERELRWLAANAGRHPVTFDKELGRIMRSAA